MICQRTRPWEERTSLGSHHPNISGAPISLGTSTRSWLKQLRQVGCFANLHPDRRDVHPRPPSVSQAKGTALPFSYRCSQSLCAAPLDQCHSWKTAALPADARGPGNTARFLKLKCPKAPNIACSLLLGCHHSNRGLPKNNQQYDYKLLTCHLVISSYSTFWLKNGTSRH